MTEAELKTHLEEAASRLEASGEDGAAQYLRALMRIGGPATALRIIATDARPVEGE